MLIKETADPWGLPLGYHPLVLLEVSFLICSTQTDSRFRLQILQKSGKEKM